MRILTLVGLALSSTLGCADRKDAPPSTEQAPAVNPPAVTAAVYARVDTEFVAIRYDSDWPEGAEMAVTVNRDAAGRIAGVQEEPRGESGDWYLSYRHVFDTTGRTTRYESIGRYFGQCPGVTEARFTQEWLAADSAPRLTRTLRDSAGTDRDPSECGHSYEFFDGEPLPSAEALIRARRIPPRL